jgi:hypothetical protein
MGLHSSNPSRSSWGVQGARMGGALQTSFCLAPAFIGDFDMNGIRTRGHIERDFCLVTRAAVRAVSTGAKARSPQRLSMTVVTSLSRCRHVAIQVVRMFRSATGIELEAVPADILG